MRNERGEHVGSPLRIGWDLRGEVGTTCRSPTVAGFVEGARARQRNAPTNNTAYREGGHDMSCPYTERCLLLENGRGGLGGGRELGRAVDELAGAGADMLAQETITVAQDDDQHGEHAEAVQYDGELVEVKRKCVPQREG
jgi:hypothetical protein